MQPVTSRKVGFQPPAVGEEEIAAVAETIRSGWLTTGPKAAELEERFEDYLGAKHAIAVTSGTAAMHLALLALGVGPGDEVITSPITWPATANVVVHCGATVVFADVREGDLNIDPEHVRELVTPRTKAILPVHLAGQPADLDPLLELGLPVVEDAAHAVESVYRGRKVGAISDVTCFSLYATKNVAAGEGGIVATDRDDVAEAIDDLRIMRRGHGSLYDIAVPGYKANLSDVLAAIALVPARQARPAPRDPRAPLRALRRGGRRAGRDRAARPRPARRPRAPPLRRPDRRRPRRRHARRVPAAARRARDLDQHPLPARAPAERVPRPRAPRAAAGRRARGRRGALAAALAGALGGGRGRRDRRAALGARGPHVSSRPKRAPTPELPATADVSVVVVTYNALPYLERCLESVRGLETIVVDNGSTDGTVAFVRERFPEVRVVEQENRGLAAGWNEGVRCAGGRYVLLLNADAWLEPGAADALVRFADEHPEAAVVGPRLLNDGRLAPALGARLPDRVAARDRVRVPAQARPADTALQRVLRRRVRARRGARGRVPDGRLPARPRAPRSTRSGSPTRTTSSSARRSTGCYRFRRSGWKVLFFPGAEVTHVGGASHGGRMFREQIRGHLIFLLKHRGRREAERARRLLRWTLLRARPALPRRARAVVPRRRALARLGRRGHARAAVTRLGAALVSAGALALLGIARLLPETGFGLGVRLAAATLVLLVPGMLVARALRTPGAAAALSWTLACLAGALVVVFATGSSLTLALLLLALCGAVALPFARRGEQTPWLVVAGGVALGILLWHVAGTIVAGDAPFHLARVRKLDDFGSLSLRAVDEFRDGGLHPGYAFPLWHAFLASVARLAGVDPSAVILHESSVLAPLAVLVTWEAGSTLFRSRPMGVAVAAGQVGLFALAPGHGGSFRTLALPSSAAQLLLFPAVLALGFRAVRDPTPAAYASVAAAGLALTLVHPTYAGYLLIVLGGWLVARLVLARRDGARIGGVARGGRGAGDRGRALAAAARRRDRDADEAGDADRAVPGTGPGALAAPLPGRAGGARPARDARDRGARADPARGPRAAPALVGVRSRRLALAALAAADPGAVRAPLRPRLALAGAARRGLPAALVRARRRRRRAHAAARAVRPPRRRCGRDRAPGGVPGRLRLPRSAREGRRSSPGSR